MAEFVFTIESMLIKRSNLRLHSISTTLAGRLLHSVTKLDFDFKI